MLCPALNMALSIRLTAAQVGCMGPTLAHHCSHCWASRVMGFLTASFRHVRLVSRNSGFEWVGCSTSGDISPALADVPQDQNPRYHITDRVMQDSCHQEYGYTEHGIAGRNLVPTSPVVSVASLGSGPLPHMRGSPGYDRGWVSSTPIPIPIHVPLCPSTCTCLYTSVFTSIFICVATAKGYGRYLRALLKPSYGTVIVLRMCRSHRNHKNNLGDSSRWNAGRQKRHSAPEQHVGGHPRRLAPAPSRYRRLYYTILYYTILYYTILYYTILYYTIL